MERSSISRLLACVLAVALSCADRSSVPAAPVSLAPRFQPAHLPVGFRGLRLGQTTVEQARALLQAPGVGFEVTASYAPPRHDGDHLTMLDGTIGTRLYVLCNAVTVDGCPPAFRATSLNLYFTPLVEGGPAVLAQMELIATSAGNPASICDGARPLSTDPHARCDPQAVALAQVGGLPGDIVACLSSPDGAHRVMVFCRQTGRGPVHLYVMESREPPWPVQGP